MLPTKPGQDREPNLQGLLLRIMLTVFDLAGGLRGNGGARSEVEGGPGRRFIFRLGATPTRDGFNRLIPYKSFYKTQRKIPAGLVKWMNRVNDAPAEKIL